MQGLKKRLTLLACALVCASCIDAGLDPTEPLSSSGEFPGSGGPQLVLQPDSVIPDQSAGVQLNAVLTDARGRFLQTGGVAYSSSSPAVASVSVGHVTALVPGRSVIRATATVGTVVVTDSTVVIVRVSTLRDHVVLNAGYMGWSRTPAHIMSGGYAEWHAGYIAVSGQSVEYVYVWQGDDWNHMLTLDLRGTGSAVMYFTTPGTYQYCSNACWDAPEFGVITVD